MKADTTRCQHGAATLMLVLGLVLLATLASAYSSRAILTDLLASQGMAKAAQARLATQSALATAEAALLRPEAGTPDKNPFAQQTQTCPTDLKGAQWQCSPLHLPANPRGGSWHALLARDLVNSPHVWQIRASAAGPDSTGQARLRASVFMPVLPPPPAAPPTSALVLNGCASEAAGSRLQICPMSPSGQACTGTPAGPAVHSHAVPDTDSKGFISASERAACMAFAPTSLPAGGALASPDTPLSRTPCNRAAWRSVLGSITPEQLRAWSQAQESQGLNNRSQPPRSIWWTDSPTDWTQDLGSAEAPVLLVFSSQACARRCPRIAAGVRIHGTVYADAGCDDEKMRGWQAGQVEGQVVVEAGLPQLSGNSQIWARPYAPRAYSLHWPEGIDPGQVQRVPGSRAQDTP